MTIILINKQTFDVIQINNVSNIAFDSSTGFWTITGSPSGTYNSKFYNMQIVW